MPGTKVLPYTHTVIILNGRYALVGFGIYVRCEHLQAPLKRMASGLRWHLDYHINNNYTLY